MATDAIRAEAFETVVLTWRRCELHEEMHSTQSAELNAALRRACQIISPSGSTIGNQVVAEAVADWTASLEAMPYVEYLRTEEWQVVREYALERAQHRCQLCNCGGRLQIHHRTYEHRGSEELADVTALCGPCHQLFHGHRSVTS
jgi:hypothetical protein